MKVGGGVGGRRGRDYKAPRGSQVASRARWVYAFRARRKPCLKETKQHEEESELSEEELEDVSGGIIIVECTPDDTSLKQKLAGEILKSSGDDGLLSSRTHELTRDDGSTEVTKTGEF